MDSFPINVIDIGVFAVLLISGVLAYARGFVHEVMSVAGWLGAILATIFGYPYAKPIARDLIPVDLAADLTAGITIFIVTLVVLSLVTRAISGRVKESALNMLDRSLGFLFGLARGALLVCVAYLGLELLVPRAEQPTWITSARTMPLIVSGAAAIAEMIPEDSGIRMPEFNVNAAPEDVLKMVAPSLDGEEGGRDSGAYTEEQRQDMQQLIESNQ